MGRHGRSSRRSHHAPAQEAPAAAPSDPQSTVGNAAVQEWLLQDQTRAGEDADGYDWDAGAEAELDGSGGGASLSRTRRDDEGRDVASTSLGVEASDEAVGGTLAVSRGPTNARYRVAGGLTVDRGPGRAGGGAELAVSVPGASVDIGGGVHVRLQEPAPRNGRWLVRGTIDRDAHARGGISGPAKVSLGLEFEDGDTFVKSFDDREAAYRFYANPRRAFALAGQPQTAEAAAEMAVGEARGETSGASVELGGEINPLGVGVGASITTGARTSFEVTRVDETHYEVRSGVTTTLGGSAHMSAGGSSLGVSDTETDSSGRTIRFDMNNPVGREAFDWTLREGRLPSGGGRPGPADVRREARDGAGTHPAGQVGEERPPSIDERRGWRVVERRTGHAEEGGIEAEVFGVPVAGVTRSSRERIQGEEADTTRYTHGSDRSNGIYTDVTEQTVDYHGATPDEHTFSVVDHVDRTSQTEASDALGHLDGSRSTGASGREGGAWQVTSRYSDAQLRRFAVGAGALTHPPPRLSSAHYGAWEAMHTRLRDAIASRPPGQSPAEAVGPELRAVGEFLEACGNDGSAILAQVSGGPARQDVGLEHDNGEMSTVFPGEAANRRLEGQISALRRQLTERAAREDPLDPVRAEAERLLAPLRERLTGVEDASRYQDLPAPMRQAEADRVRRYITTLEEIADQAAASGGNPAQQDFGWAMTDEEAATAGDLERAVQGRGVEAGDLAGSARAARAEVQRERGALSSARTACDRARQAAEDALGAHTTRHGGAHAAPRERFTSASSWLTGGALSGGYESADNDLEAGRARLRDAQRLQGEAAALLRGFEGAGEEAAMDQSVRVVEALRRATSAFGAAQRSFASAKERLDRLRQREIDNDPGSWGLTRDAAAEGPRHEERF